jgi:hypothetical protein
MLPHTKIFPLDEKTCILIPACACMHIKCALLVPFIAKDIALVIVLHVYIATDPRNYHQARIPW